MITSKYTIFNLYFDIMITGIHFTTNRTFRIKTNRLADPPVSKSICYLNASNSSGLSTVKDIL